MVTATVTTERPLRRLEHRPVAPALAQSPEGPTRRIANAAIKPVTPCEQAIP